MTIGYKKMYPQMKDSEVQGIVTSVLEKIDVNGSGQIDFTEFVVASMNQNSLLHKNKIKKAFELFDADKNGFIDRKELKMAMGGIKLSDKEWDKLIQQYDTNGDGNVSSPNSQISLEEFTHMLTDIIAEKQQK